MKSTNGDNPILKKIKVFFQQYPIAEGAGVLVAVSGGIDSTALALAMQSVSQELKVRLTLGYFNHRLRSPQEEEEELRFVTTLSEQLSVPLIIGQAERNHLRHRAKKEKRSLEEVAREERYRFLYSVATKENLNYILLGHTATDNLETQIIRFFQGSSPAGLKGIPPQNKLVLRPFLQVTRREILHFLKKQNVQPLVDSSNTHTQFLRNAVRHRIVPVLEEVFPGYATALSRFRKKMQWIDEFLQKETLQRNPWVKIDKGWKCKVEDFVNLPPILRLYTLYRIYDASVPKGEKRFPFQFLETLLVGKHLSLKNKKIWETKGIRIRLESGYLYWESNIVQDKKKGYLYLIEGTDSILLGGMFTVAVRFQARREKDSISTETAKGIWMAKSAYSTLFLRSPRPGDTLSLPSGRKRVRDLLKKIGVSKQDRDLIPILQGDGEILALFPCTATQSSIYSETLVTSSLEIPKVLDLIEIEITKQVGVEVRE
ncbi:MAG: tRNA lysidine(34) synthetase TilS [Spirochaetales bacterium]